HGGGPLGDRRIHLLVVVVQLARLFRVPVAVDEMVELQLLDKVSFHVGIRDSDAVVVALIVVLVGVVVPQRKRAPQVVQLPPQFLTPFGPFGLGIFAFGAPGVLASGGLQRPLIAVVAGDLQGLVIGGEIGVGGLPARADAGDVAAQAR